MRTCEVIEYGVKCEVKHFAKGMCKKHWKRARSTATRWSWRECSRSVSMRSGAPAAKLGCRRMNSRLRGTGSTGWDPVQDLSA